jgi:hypothetical protein
MLLVSMGLLAGRAATAERTSPIRIGALTLAWGPTPQIIGLRDGLVALGYREHEQFAIGVRFTQGDLAALPLQRAISSRTEWTSFSSVAITTRHKRPSRRPPASRLSSPE